MIYNFYKNSLIELHSAGELLKESKDYSSYKYENRIKSPMTSLFISFIGTFLDDINKSFFENHTNIQENVLKTQVVFNNNSKTIELHSPLTKKVLFIFQTEGHYIEQFEKLIALKKSFEKEMYEASKDTKTLETELFEKIDTLFNRIVEEKFNKSGFNSESAAGISPRYRNEILLKKNKLESDKILLFVLFNEKRYSALDISQTKGSVKLSYTLEELQSKESTWIVLEKSFEKTIQHIIEDQMKEDEKWANDFYKTLLNRGLKIKILSNGESNPSLDFENKTLNVSYFVKPTDISVMATFFDKVMALENSRTYDFLRIFSPQLKSLDQKVREGAAIKDVYSIPMDSLMEMEIKTHLLVRFLENFSILEKINDNMFIEPYWDSKRKETSSNYKAKLTEGYSFEYKGNKYQTFILKGLKKQKAEKFSFENGKLISNNRYARIRRKANV